jgi:hypothetical protein
MFRIWMTLAAFTLAAGIALPAASQQMPPPEGSPVQGNPYGQGAAPDPAHSPVPSSVMLAQAKKVFGQLQTGKVERSELSSSTPNANLNDATIANAQKMVGSLGKPVSFVEQRSTSQNGMSAAVYLVTFQNGQKIDFLYMVDSQGKIAALALGTPR